jgi:hypothetical protein
MFTFADEIAAAKHQEALKIGGPLEHEHGIHAFVFLSFIFAEAVKNIIETWIGVRAFHPEDCGLAQVIFLIAVTVLSVQYWWVIYESASFYGDTIFNFSCGTFEAALFYAVSYLLHEFEPLRRPFFVFAAMVGSFILVDLVKHFQHPPDQWKISNLAPRQLLRLLGIIAALLGGFGCFNPLPVSLFLLLLVGVYTGLTTYAHSKASPAAQGAMTRAETERMRRLCKKISVEKYQAKFSELVTELDDLLEQKHTSLGNSPGT